MALDITYLFSLRKPQLFDLSFTYSYLINIYMAWTLETDFPG